MNPILNPMPFLAEFLERYRYIVIEGPIGVGKTTLAKKIAALHKVELVLESHENNPFLTRYYETGGQYALATQLHFFYQRLDQLSNIFKNHPVGSRGDMRIVSDYFFEKNTVFANMVLDADERILYSRICGDLYPSHWPKPDLVIWLQAEPPVLLDRILKRGSEVEGKGIKESYLTQLCEAYTQFFQTYNQAPVFAINSQTFNPIDNEEHFLVLLEKLVAFKGAREHFNPQV